MEKSKTINLTWPEILKWLVILVMILSAFIANQIDIKYLKKENQDRKDENKILRDELKEAGKQAAAMNEKLKLIYDDTQLIKGVIIPDGFHSNRP